MRIIMGLDAHMARMVNAFTRVALIGLLPLHWAVVINNWLLAQVRPLPLAAVAQVCERKSHSSPCTRTPL